MIRKIIFSLLLAVLSANFSQAKTALVIIAHGSPMPSWRKPVLAMEQLVREKLKTSPLKGIDYVRLALMEYSEPSVASVVSDCEAQGVDTIFALPMFMAPSSHTENDLPNILGMKYNQYVRQELAEENTQLVSTDIPIILGPTMYYSYVLEKAMLQQITALSEQPEQEAVIFLAHGDPERCGFWNMMLENVQNYIRENTKIGYTAGKDIEMGHDFANELLPMLQQAAKEKKRIIVQGVYLTSDVKRMADRHGMEEKQAELARQGIAIVYSDKGILPASSKLVAEWVLDETRQWLDSRQK